MLQRAYNVEVDDTGKEAALLLAAARRRASGRDANLFVPAVRLLGAAQYSPPGDLNVAVLVCGKP